MNKETLIKLRCDAWGITEAEYYSNQCSDFSLEDMARAYRRGKNKGRAELKESVTKFSKDGLDFLHSIKSNRNCIDCESKMNIQLFKAKEHIENLLYYVKQCNCERSNYAEIEKDIKEAEQFLNSEVGK